MNRKSKILILLEQPRDAQLLSALLEKNYETLMPEKFPDTSVTYDLMILDGLMHSRYKNIVADEKARVNPLYLPVLILIAKKDINIASSFLWKTVDEMIMLPVNKTELHARVEMLIRVRKQSIELDDTHKKLIHQGREQLNLAVKAANVGLWDWNLQTNKVYYSPEWKRQIGFEDHEISDEFFEFTDRLHPEDASRCMATVKQYLENPWPDYNQEFRLRHKNGTYRWIYTQASLVYNDQGTAVRMLGSHVDITERKLTEEQLRIFHRAFEQSPVSINITDSEGNLVYLNSGFTTLSGYTTQEALGQNPRFLKSGVHPNEFYRELWETITSGNNWNGELCNRKKNGELYWVQASISPVVDPGGKITHFVAVKEDVTSRKKMIDELIAAREKAEESDRLKSAFLANMSHEIRTPMNGILGFTSLLLEPDLSSEEKAAYIEIVQKSGERMLNTVNDIIEISKIEAGLVKILMEPVNINARLFEMRDFFTLEAAKKDIQLTLEETLPADYPFVITDRQKLDGILINLVKNAIKYTDRGTIRIGCHLGDSHLEFYVKDTGVGIPGHRLEAVFNRFEQAHNAGSRVFEGSGLGLAISRSFVEMLGGKIWVESQVGVGSTFYFTLPNRVETREMIAE